jgi:UDP:flavonoid glycosyltransferase YjiC (YdhE family)
MATPKKPFTVIAAHPINGHVQPIRLIATELVKLGYQITVLLPGAYEASSEKENLKIFSLTGIADCTEKDFDTLQLERKFWPP